jgi:hypothetical protein
MNIRNYLSENDIKVWLDDERKAPIGWVSFKTVPELITFYNKNYEKIMELSLDHDLGEDTPTGYDFIKWLEEKMYFKKFEKLPKINVHSANPVGKKRMIQAIDSMKRKMEK